MAGPLRHLCLLALLSTVLSSCPNSNWFLMGSDCYLPLSVPPFTTATADDARAMCRHIHPTATLPEIFNSDDMITVQELSQGLGTWIGLYLSKTYGTWRWHSGSSVSYTHWSEGQPNNSYPCALQRKDGLWESAGCNGTAPKNHVICYVESGY